MKCFTHVLFALMGSIGLAGAQAETPPMGFSAHFSEPFPDVSTTELAVLFGEHVGCLVLRRLDGERDVGTLVHQAERARVGFVPASSFKIAHTIIALETGVSSGPAFVLERDPALAPEQDWWPDAWRVKSASMAEALPNSIVWYYQELARRIGPEREREWLERLGYGNADPGPAAELTTFWLSGDLRISALEQVDFLQRLIGGKLPIKPETAATVRELLLLEQGQVGGEDWRLFGKTGWGGFGESDPVTGEPLVGLGWFVGWLERGPADGAPGDLERWVFALNMEMDRPDAGPARQQIVRAALAELALICPQEEAAN